MMYAHLQRSSPTTATAIASATVTIQNVPNAIPPFASRGSSAHYPNQYHMNTHVDYRPDGRAKSYQIPQMYTGDMYNPDHPTVNESQGYHRGQSHQNNLAHSGRIHGRSRQGYHQNYSNHQQYYYSKNQSGGESYPVVQNNYQGYHGEHPGYSHYNYTGNNMYPTEGTENMNQHMPGSVPVNHDPSTNYYSNDNMHSMSKVQNQEYPNKVGYYENNTYNPNHLPPNSDSSYGMNTEMFPGTNGGTTAIMTPPNSVQTENSDSYNNFHQFYGGETQAQVGPPGESSNSSSDFNFLSNLANDYTPEYYQI